MTPHPSPPSLRKTRVFRDLVLLCAATAFSLAQATDVVAFTDAQHPLSNASGARVVLLTEFDVLA